MSFVSVRVVRPQRRKIYLDGDYTEAAATSPNTFAVAADSHVFETLTADGRVDWRARVTCRSGQGIQEIELGRLSRR